MEDFHPQWSLHIGKFHTVMPPNEYLAKTITFKRGKILHTDDSDTLFLNSEKIPRPRLNSYEQEPFFFPNSNEEDFLANSDKNFKFADHTHDRHFIPDQDDIRIDRSSFLNFQLKNEDYRQDNYIRRSRGVSFFSDPEILECGNDQNQGLELIRYFPKNVQQESELNKEPSKNAFEESCIEEEENVLNLCNFSILRPTNVAQSLLLNQPVEAEQNDENKYLLSNSGVQNSKVPINITSKEDDSLEMPRKKRKYNPILIPDQTSNKETFKSMKLQKRKSEGINSSNPSVIKKDNIRKSNIQKSVKTILSLTPASIHTQEQTPDPYIENNDTLTEQIFQEKLSNNLSNVLKDLKNLNIVPMMKAKSVNDEASIGVNKSDGFGRLFQGFQLPEEVEKLISTSKIFSSLKQLTTKKIGTLTREERAEKVERYLQKRKERTWNKRINYDCRRRVAETRLRVKGRFVTKAQAFAMLEEEGIYRNPNFITDSEMKILLEGIIENRKLKADKGKDSRKSNKNNKLNVRNQQEDSQSHKTPGSEKEEAILHSRIDSFSEDF